jgi:hypothetical protein
MGRQTISFVATDKLKDWIDEQAEMRMTSRSAAVQQILAEVASSQMKEFESVEEAQEYDAHEDFGVGDGDNTGSTGESDEVEGLESERTFQFATKREADAVRTQFEEHLSGDDDGRLKKVTFVEGTPGDVVEELERRSGD